MAIQEHFMRGAFGYSDADIRALGDFLETIPEGQHFSDFRMLATLPANSRMKDTLQASFQRLNAIVQERWTRDDGCRLFHERGQGGEWVWKLNN